jgi:hypothetical protein
VIVLAGSDGSNGDGRTKRMEFFHSVAEISKPRNKKERRKLEQLLHRPPDRKRRKEWDGTD